MLSCDFKLKLLLENLDNSLLSHEFIYLIYCFITILLIISWCGISFQYLVIKKGTQNIVLRVFLKRNKIKFKTKNDIHLYPDFGLSYKNMKE